MSSVHWCRAVAFECITVHFPSINSSEVRVRAVSVSVSNTHRPSHHIPSHPISLSVFILQSANVKWLRTQAEVRTHQFDGWRRIVLFDKWFPSTRCLAPRTKAPIRSALIVCDVEAIDVRLREPRRVASLDVQTLRAAPRHRHRRSAVTPIAFDFNDYSTRVNSIRKAKRRYGTQRSAEQRSAEQLVTRS